MENNESKRSRSKYRTDYPADFKFNYKDPATLSRFLVEGGKIIPSRVSKLSRKQQASLSNAIKRARQLALLPQGTLAYDHFYRGEPLSPVPFEY